MKRKPTGLKYRNLHARSDSIYYERVWQGKRFCLSTKTDDWTEAAAFRDLWEERKGLGRLGVALRAEAPRFAEFAAKYLEEDTSHLAPTTRGERDRMLTEEGPLLPTLGALRLDEITAGRLREWWHAEVTTKVRPSKTGQPAKIGRSTKTGRSPVSPRLCGRARADRGERRRRVPNGAAPQDAHAARTLSKRLHRTLLAEYRARFAPNGEALVLPNLEPGNFRGRDWRRIVNRARIGHRALKDLRDTFASQLLTAGV
jgi:hypothetical protein